jgi:hypothetical protein
MTLMAVPPSLFGRGIQAVHALHLTEEATCD